MYMRCECGNILNDKDVFRLYTRNLTQYMNCDICNREYSVKIEVEEVFPDEL